MGGSIEPPETLVFGAKLQCTQSSHPSFLLVDEYREENIDGLPMACVIDREPETNIPPFVTCTHGWATHVCSLIQLTPKWENPEPQNVFIGAEEIITSEIFEQVKQEREKRSNVYTVDGKSMRKSTHYSMKHSENEGD